ncbi:T7SS effector LXG polymorphic toxin, partial [Peribacillus sp. NPDC097206]
QKITAKGEGSKGITKGEYKNLRKKTPSNEIRKMVNPDGPKVDPVYGYEVDKFEADHIVSMKEITEMDGFSGLTREQQIEILNLKDNFVGLGKSSNASKGAHSWAEWKGHSKMGEVPVNVRMEMIEKEEQAREALKVAIEERLK